MKNKILFRHSITLNCCAMLLAFAMVTTVAGQLITIRDPRGESGNVKTEMVKVHAIGSPAIIPQAGASLSSDNSGVLGTISTSGLTPGHVITLWWAIYNNPEYCAMASCIAPDLDNPAVNGSLQFGGGTIADAGGRVSFMGYLAEGDNTGFYLNPNFPNMPNPAPGILNTKKAQIHLVVRTHGLPNPDPVIFSEQLTSFTGGCSVAVPPCASVQAAPFLK